MSCYKPSHTQLLQSLRLIGQRDLRNRQEIAHPATRQDFINRARRLAADFIKASDGFNALAAELNYIDLSLPSDQGGLTVDDFVTLNADLTPEQFLGFFATMQALLEPLTVEQKKSSTRRRAARRTSCRLGCNALGGSVEGGGRDYHYALSPATGPLSAPASRCRS